MDFINPYSIGAIILAITVHEYAHALASYLLGDPTAQRQGRLTLNPLSHLDPLGTIMLLVAGIGWGRPVPYNPANLKNPRLDAAIIAAAGPMTNLLLAASSVIAIKFFTFDSQILFQFYSVSLMFNVVLMAFNLLPIHPLDGAKIASLFFRDQAVLARFLAAGPPLLFGVIIFEKITSIPILVYPIAFLYDLTVSALTTIL